MNNSGNQKIDLMEEPNAIFRVRKEFSFEASLLYDIESLYISSRYKEAHSIQNSIVINKLQNMMDPVILDFGCGTGTDGLSILSNLKTGKYIGIDYSIHMLNIALNKFQDNSLLSRSLFINNDLRNLKKNYLLEKISSLKLVSCVESVISSLVLHHYTAQFRLNLYKLIFQILNKNGLFILTDLFSNSISVCSDFAFNQELEDLRGSIHNLKKHNIKLDKFTTLSADHYNKHCLSIDLYKETNIILNVGFQNVDIVFRSGQLAVLIISK